MNKLWPILIFCFLCFHAKGQQAIQYSLYSFNPYNYNPAYAGLEGSLVFTGVFRKQWVGFPGSPMSQNFNAHLPWHFMNGGAGLSVENDFIGAERNTTLNLSYNYIARLNNEQSLSIGVGAGFWQKSLDGSKLRAPEGDYEGGVLNHNDLVLSEGREGGIAPMANAGIYYKSTLLDVGIAANNLLASKIKNSGNSIPEIQLSRHYFFNFGMHLPVGEKVMLEPSVFLKTDLIQTQIDFSTILRYNHNIFGGASFRGYSKQTIDAIVFLAGMDITKNLTLVYGFDLGLSSLRTFNKGSHEVLVKYNLNKDIGGEIPQKIIFNPRH